MADEYILETHKLSKHFGGVHAVEDVDFRLRHGELRCVIGPNGAGKSTFFKMITAQLKPSDGRITFQGRDISGEQRHAISRMGIGIKNQVPDVFDGISTRENIWAAARFRHTPKRAEPIVDKVLSQMNLAAVADDLVGELSHGQRQWVEFGMVMSSEPKIILLDEPTAGMTVEETSLTADLIHEINKTTPIIVVEHDMQFIRKIADIVTVLHQGKILAEDTMAKIQQNQTVLDVYLGKSGSA
jgi:branched-chain amino acid transport system ATP-binding protein/urea transport system ATP-binding protein